jgi:hypothetical protein
MRKNNFWFIIVYIYECDLKTQGENVKEERGIQLF